MAVIEKGQKAIPSKKDSIDEKDYKVTLIEDFDNDAPEGDKRKFNFDDDPFLRAAPPSPGLHNLTLSLGAKGKFEFIEGKRGDYYKCTFVAIVNSDDPKDNGSYIECKVSTAFPQGCSISTMAALLHRLGVEVPERATDKQIASLFKKTLEKEPQIKGEIDWKAWLVSGEDDDKEYNIARYKGRALSTADNFPKDENDNPQYEVEVTNKDGDTVTVRAKAFVKNWVKAKPKSKKAVSNDDEEDEKPKKKVNFDEKPKKKVSEEEEDLD